VVVDEHAALLGRLTAGHGRVQFLPPRQFRSEGGQLALEPVGRTRRARVWSAVAKHFELEDDADPEELTTSVGNVSMAVRLERTAIVATSRRTSAGLTWGWISRSSC
jgi:hypothetical protein